MVTSQKMIEKEIGYRGSKSRDKARSPLDLDFTKVYKNVAKSRSILVKEQRVDGGWNFKEGFNSLKEFLRCTLMRFERNYQVRNPSCYGIFFSIKRVKFYVSGAAAINHGCSKQITQRFSHTLETVQNLVNPWFVTGFTDAEGCLYITLTKNPERKTG